MNDSFIYHVCRFLFACIVPFVCAATDYAASEDCASSTALIGASLLQTASQRVDVSNLKLSENLRQPSTPEWLSQMDVWKVSTFMLAGLVLVFGALLLSGQRSATNTVENRPSRSPPTSMRSTRQAAQQDSWSPGPRSLSPVEESKAKESNAISSRSPSRQSQTALSSADGDVEEDDDIPQTSDDSRKLHEYIEENFRSRKLFVKIVSQLGQVWGVLALMYWSLLTRKSELMDCFGHEEGALITHTCTYTKACLRGFPVLAANVTLVMTVRILLQQRIYYSLLRLGYVMDFADTHVLKSGWPWICAFSMLQGGLNLLLKIYYDSHRFESGEAYLMMARKFVLPGYIFLAFFMKYVDIEDSLIPLNRLAEKDYSQENRHCATLAKVLAMDERVMAFDARHRDIIGECESSLGRKPTLDDIFKKIIEGYEAAHIMRAKHVNHHWGLFRSLWPASVLVDRRLDWRDSRTREWLISFNSLLGACIFAALISVLFFFRNIYENLSRPEYITHRSAIVLDTAVLVCHGILVTLFLHHTVHGMFFFSMQDHLKEDGAEGQDQGTSSQSTGTGWFRLR